MPTKRKLWPMDGHTAGKHLVLRVYLNAWFGILSNRFDQLLFVDGFAGPGEYKTGEDGSPLVALKAVIEHTHSKVQSTKIRYIFIDCDKARLEHLQAKVFAEIDDIPPNIRIDFFCETFEKATDKHIIPAQEGLLGNPCFIMIDPFGVNQTPLNAITKIMSFPRTEVYISLMYEFINRFKKQPEFESSLNMLFGCTDWQKHSQIDDKEARKKELYKLYKNKLKESCAKQVVHFDLYNGNKLKYGVFFATQNILGSQKIKEAIWKVVPKGDFAFRSENNPQLNINIEKPNFEPLQEILISYLKDRGFVSIKEILEYIDSDSTEFHRGHVKANGLKVIENKGELAVSVKRTLNKPRRALTYPDDCLIMIE
ncbi:three-Cys-motif partner protein TcmP [Agaribacterium sp. ZY112]|uniref:three-Cys-motif partner protein TcmP n=1 Tax=Agaribacterium sp. ZY112 TaxID=3233574 RepID=UPI003524C655